MTGDEVRRCEFREAFAGYKPGQVDPFLERVADALDAGTPISALVRSVEFDRSRRLVRGYRVEDVDALLERLRLDPCP
jgi:DivIVA domain-containing protein